jgi:hypothetical protein
MLFPALFGCSEIERSIDPDNYRARADSNVWASKNDIIAAAQACGESNVKPVPAGDAWAIGTIDGKSISAENSRCIDVQLDRQNLLVTK